MSNRQLPGASGVESWVVLGEILRPHGLRGEIKLRSEIEEPDNFLLPGLCLRSAGKLPVPVKVKSWRRHKNIYLLTLDGIDRIEQVESMVGAELVIKGDLLPPPEAGEYYHYQLLGLEAFNEQGDCLGRLAEIIATAGHDVFVIRGDGRAEILLPAVSAYVLAVEPDSGRIVVDPEGGGWRDDDAD